MACGSGQLIQPDFGIPVRFATPAGGGLDPSLEPLGVGDEARWVLVDLTTQVDLQQLGASAVWRSGSRSERRERVSSTLREVASRSQSGLEGRFLTLKRRGQVLSWRGFSIVNRLAVEATPAGIREMAGWPEVARVVARSQGGVPVWSSADLDGLSGPTGERRPRASWALEEIGAEDAWARGLDGQGVTVGLIDSGASSVHEQLEAGFRGEEAWHDPSSGREVPMDAALGHGTGVLSVAVGRNVEGIRLGVAPGAEWVACAALPKGHYDNLLFTECADWMLHVGRPDVLINAWLLPDSGCVPWLRGIIEAWRMAEILPVFAAGNNGPKNDHSPANYVGLAPDGGAVVSVGAVDREGELLKRSSTGPNSCDGSIFPRLVAPGEELLVALPLSRSTYLTSGGTSYAAGLVAGAAALLVQSASEMSITEVEAALVRGAVDLGPPGPDSYFGHGRLDIPGALAALMTKHAVNPELSEP